MNTKFLPSLIGLFLIALLLAACGGQAAEPVDEVLPAATSVPPTETAVPPTATPVPPTVTPVSPTETPLPPTETPKPTPTKAPGKSPSPRGYVGLAYDAESDLMIMFGGQIGECCSPETVTAETWTFDVSAVQWTRMDPATAPIAGWGAITYDAESDRTIVFGVGAYYPQIGNETWAYDTNTNTWTQMADGPSRHLGAELAYDAESDRVILFGGWNMARLYDDTWAYDFNSDTWTEMNPTTRPKARNFHGMSYDAESDRVIIWGLTGNFKQSDGSVWAYDFNTDTWEPMPIGDPFPEIRDWTRLAYDAESDRTILYGGLPRGDQTWAYDYNSNTWTLMEPSSVPANVSRHAMEYSPAADRVIVFGGKVWDVSGFTDEMWSYDYNSDTWEKLTP
jgi:hypothetical protein